MKQFVRRSLARVVAKLPIGILHGAEHADIFQKAGIHITLDHFYQPIPNTDQIDQSLWDQPSTLTGIDCNIDEQLALLQDISVHGYVDEYFRLPSHAPSSDEYGRDGGFGRPDAVIFGGIDGAMLYGMVREYRPAQIIEIGAGQSTLLSNLALKANADNGYLTSIDPYPQSYLRERTDRLFKLMEQRAERVPLAVFETLNRNDILFIDSSHVVKIDGDVLYEMLEILPRLKPGVLIHIHDIFLPHHYPKKWVLTERKFWTEQYLVQAFLAFNASFKIIWSSAMMETWHRDKLLPRFPNLGGSSLWLQRVAD